MRLTVIPMVALVAALASAQGPVAFEVATVRPAEVGAAPRRVANGQAVAAPLVDPLRFRLRLETLRSMIARAYETDFRRVVGPDWLDTGRFDVVAKLPEGAAKAQIPAMLRAMLAERFGLRVHKETRESAAYVLTEAKGGHKMAARPEGTEPALHAEMSTGLYRAEFTRDWREFAVTFLVYELELPVVDQTGLQGKYSGVLERRLTVAREDPLEVQLEKARENLVDSVGSLGLKLERRKAPVEFVVVDAAERMPREN